MKNKNGVSIIALIITIIVIIILAVIIILSSEGNVSKALFAKFVHEFGEYTDQVTITVEERKKEAVIKNEKKRKDQYYYEVATRTRLPMETDPIATGMVADLKIETIPPNVLTGREYYIITSDANINGYKKNIKFYGDSNGEEKHYVTDEGIVFTLPGFQVQQEDGRFRYYITSNAYYIGLPYLGSGDNMLPEDKIPSGDDSMSSGDESMSSGDESMSSGDESSSSGDENPPLTYPVTKEGWHYDPSSNAIVGYSGKLSNRISVPSKIVEKDGTVISIKIIKELVLSKEIKTLVIEEGIEEIEGNCFEDSRKLRAVTLPDSLKKIGNYAFANSKILETIILPKGLKEIGEGAFKNCRLTTITIPEAVESIGKDAFSGNTNLNRVYIEKAAGFYSDEELRTFGINPSKVIYMK